MRVISQKSPELSMRDFKDHFYLENFIKPMGNGSCTIGQTVILALRIFLIFCLPGVSQELLAYNGISLINIVKSNYTIIYDI